jgi:hypothetical protein
MGKLIMLAVLVMAAVAAYVSWPEIREAMAPREDSSEDKVVESLKKMKGVFSSKNDPHYHCNAECPDRTGGTRSPIALEKAKAMDLTPCDRCCK